MSGTMESTRFKPGPFLASKRQPGQQIIVSTASITGKKGSQPVSRKKQTYGWIMSLALALELVCTHAMVNAGATEAVCLPLLPGACWMDDGEPNCQRSDLVLEMEFWTWHVR